MPYAYDPDILETLARHGIQPTPETSPEAVKEFVSDLYRHELRRLRDRLVRGEIPKAEYSNHVIALRKRYWILSLPLFHWARQAQP